MHDCIIMYKYMYVFIHVTMIKTLASYYIFTCVIIMRPTIKSQARRCGPIIILISVLKTPFQSEL